MTITIQELVQREVIYSVDHKLISKNRRGAGSREQGEESYLLTL